jgi:DNA-directed RNA polymerase
VENLSKQGKRDTDYFLFIGANEKIIFNAHGIFDNNIDGNLILTDKQLFFYFISNVSRDRIFIATYPYIISSELKEGVFHSTLIIKNKKETFEIKKINKEDARKFYLILSKIISDNKNIKK